MSIPKNHHYVPQGLLRYFTFDDKRVYIYDKHRHESFRNSISKVGSEEYFNSFYGKNGERVIYEKVFDSIDGDYATLTRKIIENENLSCLSPKELSQLADCVAAQFIRTKLYRESLASLNQQLGEWIQGMGIPTDAVKNYKKYSENDVRFESFLRILGITPISQILQQKIIALIVNFSNCPFVISDHPVVFSNPFPYGRRGFDEPGNITYLPLSPKFTLAYFCQSYSNGVQSAWKEAPKGMEEGLNLLQYLQAFRFIYSQNDYSQKAREFASLSASSYSSPPQRLFHLGMDSNYSCMPDGEHIVLYCVNKKHFMLKRTDVVNNMKCWNFNTRDINTLRQVEKNFPIESAMIFDGTQQRGEMRRIKMSIAYGEDQAEVSICNDFNFGSISPQ